MSHGTYQGKVLTCAKGCGAVLRPWWKFCPACGQSFGATHFGNVIDSLKARDGKVRATRPKPTPPPPPREDDGDATEG